jgi:L-ascorbate metabolism protein UlaG (beta-lactamase superfamily)
LAATKTLGRIVGVSLLVLVIAVGLAATIVPHYLDRLYYRGAVSDHYDGQRFANPDGDADTAGSPAPGGRIGFFWRYLTGSDGRPPWPATVPIRAARPAELLAPLAPAAMLAPASPAQAAAMPMRVTWIGHASVLVQTPALTILTDPVWSETAGPLGFGPQRVARPGIALADLPKIDLVLLSHDHYDHLDLATLKTLWARDRPMIVTSLGNDAILRSEGIGGTVAADWNQAVTVMGRPRVDAGHYWAKPIRVLVTRNHHWGSRWFADRNRALWSSFVVELPGGNLFFAGDTGWGDGRWPLEAARTGPIRLALVPIGAFRFVPGQMSIGSHIGPVQAVDVFRRLGATTALPIHWGTFRLSYEQYATPPRLLEIAMRCSGIGRTRSFAAHAIGRPFDVPPYAGVVAPNGVAQAEGAALARCVAADPVTRTLR